MFLVSAQSKRARSHVTCSPARQSWGTMVAVQWRIQGRGPGGPPPIIFRTKWGPRGRKNFFETGPPPLPHSLDDPPPPLSEGLDPPLQSKNRRFCWFLAVILVSSGSADKSACSTIKLLILARFLAYIIFFHLPVSGLNPMNVFLFHSSPALFPKKKKMPFSRPSRFLGKSRRDKVPPRIFHYFSEWPGNLISQVDHPNCSRPLMSHTYVIHTFTVRKRLLSAWFKWSVEMLLKIGFCNFWPQMLI